MKLLHPQAAADQERNPPTAPARRATSRRGPETMKSIGEISIAPPVRAGFREFSSRRSGNEGSRRRLSIATRRESRDRLPPARCAPLGPRPGAGIERDRSARAVARHDFEEIHIEGKRPFPTRLRKTLRRYWGARVSYACCARLRLTSAAAAPSTRRCGWKTGFFIGENSFR